MNAHEEACYFSKARELGDNVAVANFGCRVHDSEQGTDSTGIEDLGHAVYSLNFAPASNQSDDNAAYESDDQSPDTNYVLHFSSYEGNALHVLERNEDIRIPSNEFRNDEVNDQYSQQGEASNLPGEQFCVRVQYRFVQRMIAIAFAFSDAGFQTMDNKETANAINDDGADDTSKRAGIKVRAEICRRDNVLNLRSTGQAVHRSRKCTQSDAGRNQVFRIVSFFKEGCCERIYCEYNDEHENAAVGQDRTGQYDRNNGFCRFFAQAIDDSAGQTTGKTRFFHDLTKNST